jgi:hypothetical protein
VLDAPADHRLGFFDSLCEAVFARHPGIAPALNALPELIPARAVVGQVETHCAVPLRDGDANRQAVRLGGEGGLPVAAEVEQQQRAPGQASRLGGDQPGADGP